MPKSRVNCPNCRQPIMADIEQLFDAGEDPSAKQRLLSGNFNQAQCPHCGYQGLLATPIVYHDPENELLFTYFPPELGLPLEEQERLIGPFINQVVNRLPQERRKAYLLRPQTMLTMQTMVERILEADGITKEMIQAQQNRLALLQRLVGASEEVLNEIVKQEESLMDADFFNLLNRLGDAAMMSGDQESARRLSDLQKKLIQMTEYGRKLQEQSQEVEAAIRSLQEAGEGLTREKLLELIIQAPNETRLNVLVSLARQGLDYTFFQLLSDRIERARGDGRARLIELRERLLELTRQYDQQVEARLTQSRQLINTLLEADDVAQATVQNLPVIDDFFVQVLNEELATARKNGDLGRSGKLQEIVNVIQQASAMPPEIALIEELLDAPDEQARRAWLEAHKEEITPEFLETFTGLIAQTQSSEDTELLEHLQTAYRTALRFSMQTNLDR